MEREDRMVAAAEATSGAERPEAEHEARGAGRVRAPGAPHARTNARGR
jgi:hypothetical protein